MHAINNDVSSLAEVASIALAIEMNGVASIALAVKMNGSCNLSFSPYLGALFARIQPDWLMLCGLWPMTGCHCSDWDQMQQVSECFVFCVAKNGETNACEPVHNFSIGQRPVHVILIPIRDFTHRRSEEH